MKKFLLLPAIALIALVVKAQNYSATKTLLTLNQLKQAKESIDKNMTNEKFASKAEAYLLKASIYAGLAMDKTISATPEVEQLREEAATAFDKYMKMDPSLDLLKDPIYQNGPVNLYSSLYASGYKSYENKDWEKGYQTFKKTVDLADLMIKQKILNVPIDTNSVILAGVTAENANHKDEAANYYTRLADLKLSGEGYETLYRFLVNHYFEKRDIPLFEKYKAYGKELYPKSAYFDYDKIDFAVGLSNNFNAKMKTLEEILATDPANFKANESMGELIYDTLNPRNDEAVIPSNAAELERKMIGAFSKASEANPGTEIPYLYVGDHFINKSIVLNDSFKVFTDDMRKRTKPGAKPSSTDIAKRDAINEQYGNALEGARDPYEKAAAILGKKGELTIQDKQQYKKVTSYLSDIYAFKKNQAKAKSNTADITKYTAEEKKWSDMYDSIK